MGAESYTMSTPIGTQHVTLVEIGSNGNIISINAAREFDSQSRQHGLMPKAMNLETLPCDNGVGSGAAICRIIGTFAIACNYQHSNEPPTAKVDAFVGNVAEGSGSDLPAILDLNTLLA
eukprot:8682466-Pyramimonas_sp.AAC.1